MTDVLWNCAALNGIVERNQVWPVMPAKDNVGNPVPPQKTSLDGLCEALDHASCKADVPDFKQRRDEEDLLSATRYADLPYPENQLVALAHSLMARGVIAEDDLKRRMSEIRARLEARLSELKSQPRRASSRSTALVAGQSMHLSVTDCP